MSSVPKSAWTRNESAAAKSNELIAARARFGGMPIGRGPRARFQGGTRNRNARAAGLQQPGLCIWRPFAARRDGGPPDPIHALLDPSRSPRVRGVAAIVLETCPQPSVTPPHAPRRDTKAYERYRANLGRGILLGWNFGRGRLIARSPRADLGERRTARRDHRNPHAAGLRAETESKASPRGAAARSTAMRKGNGNLKRYGGGIEPPTRDYDSAAEPAEILAIPKGGLAPRRGASLRHANFRVTHRRCGTAVATACERDESGDIMDPYPNRNPGASSCGPRI